MHSDQQAFRRARPRLTRQEWMLVALGLAVWIALGAGGVWLVHQLTRKPDSCGTSLDEAPTHQAKGASSDGPRNALQLLAGTGRCK